MPPNFTVALVSTFCCWLQEETRELSCIHHLRCFSHSSDKKSRYIYSKMQTEFPRLRMPHKGVVVTLIQKGIKMKFTSL